MRSEEEEIEEICQENAPLSEKYEKVINDGAKKNKLSGMYRDWFLDYASYVILERAVPHISDGLKPVQRRILHAMKLMDDGRHQKVASLVGATMPFHPHGNASIEDALVQLGQKNLLIDCQGNWGNILTGDPAAAGRYIEARLTPFANEVLFNPKTTEWVNSYDGRNREPVNLPVKFPLLLAQGSEGIAVGLASKILPHNFNELIDASIAYLKGEDFLLEPDFPTGGFADTSAYNRGLRGGKVRIRANIQKVNKNTLVITEIPFGKTTEEIMDSILKANEKGKIRIRKIDDNTAEHAEIVIQLYNDISPDKTIDALYATTDCEVSISPNTCVIKDSRPQFIGVDEILKASTDNTKELIRRELEIKLEELGAEWHYMSLEKIFFENRIYKILENDAASWEEQLAAVKSAMLQYSHLFRKEITDEDINKLVEKPVKKISRFDIKAVTDKIADIEKKEDGIRYNLEHLTEYCIGYFTSLKEKYGADHPRKTKITSFENIAVTTVVANNAKLYINRSEGFIGTSSKKIEEAEYVCDCSDIDEIIVFIKDGRYTIRKISEKQFVERNIVYAAVFKRQDERTTYNVAYRDGRNGAVFGKRFTLASITRDKWYTVTKGTPDSTMLWFSANKNAEAEIIKVCLRPRPKLKKLIFDFDFATLMIKGRGSIGNLITKYPVQKIMLRSAGVSTIGGKNIWFDSDINRINEEGRGILLGEFESSERIVALCRNGVFYTTPPDPGIRFNGELIRIEKFDPDKVYSLLYKDSDGFIYIKRFTLEQNDNSERNFISNEEGATFIELNDDLHPAITVTFEQNGKKPKEPITIDVEEFIAVKSYKAKGKRVGNFVAGALFTEPLVKESPDESTEENPEASPEAGTEVSTLEDLTTYGTNIIYSADDEDEPTLF